MNAVNSLSLMTYTFKKDVNLFLFMHKESARVACAIRSNLAQ